jgi:acetyltransferase
MTRTAPAIRIRPVRPDDGPELVAHYAALSADARYARFLRATAGLSDREANGFCRPDHDHADGFVAEVHGGPDDGRLVGHLCLDPLDDGRVELAVAVADDHRRQGIGRRLLAAAVAWAEEHRIDRMAASMLVTNTPILALIRSTGLPVEVGRPDAGIVRADIRVPARATA